MEQFLFFLHYSILLQYGVLLSVTFSGIRLDTRDSKRILIWVVLICGALQLLVYTLFGEDPVWMLYPLITHLPVLLSLLFLYRRRPLTALATVATAYLCCQPAKWFGLLVQAAGGTYSEETVMRILVLILTEWFVLRYTASGMSEIYNKDNRSILIFGIVPMVYYAFDYTMTVFTDLWLQDNGLVREFLPFFLCMVHLIFCLIYYREYEQKADVERKEQLLRFTLDQQTKEIEAIKRSEHEIRLLRHDLRLFLTNLSVCVEEDDKETAQKLITRYTNQVEATAIKRYCTNDTLNYTISSFASRCRENQVDFICNIRLGEGLPDVIMLSTILSNALDNALNAQIELPQEQRSIQLMMKSSGSKTLLSVKNTCPYETLFIDGLPVSLRSGHGYGTQSIRYMTERLGGNCQFSNEKGQFILRVVI